MSDSDLSKFGDRLRKLVKPDTNQEDEIEKELALVQAERLSLSTLYKRGLKTGAITPQFHYSN